MKNFGVIVKMEDGLRAIVYAHQPLCGGRFGLIVLYVVDGNNNKILNGDGTPKFILRTERDHNNEMQASTLIGHVC